jgi:hypothetical protein
MTPDDTSHELRIVMPPRPSRQGPGPRHILFAGVAGACALGVGLGLWARPAIGERQAAVAPIDASKPAAAQPARKLRIVIDDRPAPVGAPIDVLPPPPAWPAGPPEGLTRVQTVMPPGPPAAPAPVVAPQKPTLAPLVASAVAATRLVIARAEAHVDRAAHLASAEAAAATPAQVPRARSGRAPIRLAAAEASSPKGARRPKPASKPAKLELAHAQAAHAAAVKAAAHRAELAQAARAEKLKGLKLAKAAKAAKLEQLKLAKAEARGRAEARAEAKAEAFALARDDARKRQRLASLMQAVQRVLPRHVRPHEAAPVEVAKLDRRHVRKPHGEAKVERASLRSRKAPRFAEPSTRAPAIPLAPRHASGLMKVSTPRCASRDPGAARVCADPSLGAADRQLARAYQGARAAGVPDAQLQRQQQRWLAARSAAAREAPWAVHDVYLARIAELNGLARDAHGDGY